MLDAIHAASDPMPKVVFVTPWLPEASLGAAEDLAAHCRLAKKSFGGGDICANLMAMLYTAYRLSGKPAFYDAALTVRDFAWSVLGDDPNFKTFASNDLNVLDHELYCDAHPAPTLAVPSLAPGQQTYAIHAGDSPGRIAAKVRVTLKALVAANPQVRWFFGEGPGCAPQIEVGTVVIIPAPGS